MNYQARVIDLKNLLVECLFGWRIILGVAIFGAVFGAGLVSYINKNREPTREITYEEQIESAKAGLTDAEINDVEELYSQYRISGQTYSVEVDHANNALIMEMDVEGTSVCEVAYVLDTNQAYLADAIGSLIMTDNIFEQITDILGVDSDPQYLSELLDVWDDATTPLTITNDAISDTRFQSVIYVRAIAYTDEQSKEIIDLVDAQLRGLIRDKNGLDPEISLTYMDEIPTDAPTTIRGIQVDLANKRTNAAKQFETLAQNDTGRLSRDQTTYYNLLISDSHESITKESGKPMSVIRYSIEGFVCDGMVAVVVLLLYLSFINKRVRSLMELETTTSIPTLAVYERRLKERRDPITKWAIRLQTGDKAVQDEISYQSVLETRIEQLMQHSGRSNLYVVSEGESVLGNDADFNMTSGMPESSESAMQAFLHSDSVILVTYMYRTELSDLSNVIGLCQIHDKQILGNIVIYDR